jgi:addiction module HigA family antidote
MKTTIKHRTKKKENALPPIHPGEILREDILPSVGLSVTGTAKALGVSRQMLHGILSERKPLSAVMCLRIARLFGGSPDLWMRLQAAYDLKNTERNKKVMEHIARIVPLSEREEIRA